MGARLVLDHETPGPGVLVPEQLEPAKVFRAIKGRDVEIRERILEERILT